MANCYLGTVNRLLAVCLAALALAGCKRVSLSPFVAPRVTGRVLSADTGAPLTGVKVTSISQAAESSHTMPPRGGELLMADYPAETDEDGRFALEAVRALTPFRGTHWFSVQLCFERAGYQRLRASYSSPNVGTNSPKGEPLLDAGDILLQPLQK